MTEKVTNIVIAGLGGQGVLKASDILSEVVFRSGFDVKKSEIHGMSQRGGSVSSDVRFGREVLSPMVPKGQADYLLVLTESQVENNQAVLKENGILIVPNAINQDLLPHPRSINIALLGVLSKHLDIPEQTWLMIIKANLPEKLHDLNERAFALGRNSS
jgi:indolepyruvate ferredoxin oxidoreductase beta subunit